MSQIFNGALRESILTFGLFTNLNVLIKLWLYDTSVAVVGNARGQYMHVNLINSCQLHKTRDFMYIIFLH